MTEKKFEVDDKVSDPVHPRFHVDFSLILSKSQFYHIYVESKSLST